MPLYIIKNKKGNCNEDVYQKESSCNSKFFSDLATKLLEMAESVNKRMEDIKKNCGGVKSGGIYFGAITVPVMSLGVKYEYIEYIKRFGPPTDGQFDETKLKQLRKELGIDTNSITSL